MTETMRQIDEISKAGREVSMKQNSWELASGQMAECFVLLSTLGGECLQGM